MAMDNLSLLMQLVKEGKLSDSQAMELAGKHGIVIPTAQEAPLPPRAATFAGTSQSPSSEGDRGDRGSTAGGAIASYIIK